MKLRVLARPSHANPGLPSLAGWVITDEPRTPVQLAAVTLRTQASRGSSEEPRVPGLERPG